MDKKGEGDHYYNTKYKFSPRVRELLEAKMKDKEMSYMRAENIVTAVMRAEYKETLTTLNDKAKEKIMGLFKIMFTTNLPKKNVESVVGFLKEHYTDDEIKVYVDHALKEYKPGRVYMGVRISNHTIQYFLEELNTYPLMKGIIVNKKYINDLIPFFDRDVEDFEFDKDSLMVEKDYTNEMLEVFNGLVVDTDVRFHNDDDIFVLATFDDDVAEKMKESFKDMEVQSIPVHMFEWSKTLQVILPEKEKDETVLEELETTPEVESETPIIPPTNITKETLFESSKPEDVFFNGSGYGSGTEFMDDYFSVTMKHNNKKFKYSFDTDGGLYVGPLTKPHSPGEYVDIDVDNIDNCGVDFLILRGFVGTIDMVAKVKVYDDKDKEIIIYADTSKCTDDIYYDLTKKYEDEYGDADVDITIEINGTFDKKEPLTKEIYNSL